MPLMKIKFLILFLLPFFLFAQSVEDGIKAMDNEKIQDAKQIFSALTSNSPSNAELWYYLGNVYSILAQKDSARFIFNKGVSANPMIASNYIGIGKLLLDENRTAEAKVNFDKALSFSKSKDSKAFTLIADAYSTTSGQKDIIKAIELLNKAIENQ